MLFSNLQHFTSKNRKIIAESAKFQLKMSDNLLSKVIGLFVVGFCLLLLSFI